MIGATRRKENTMKIISILVSLCLLTVLLAGCGQDKTDGTASTDAPPASTQPAAPAADLGDDTQSFGNALEELNAYAGHFEEDTQDVTVQYVSGTSGCYTLEGNVLTFTNVQADSVYSVSGKLKGSIVIDVGDDYKFDLELKGLSVVSNDANPITVISGDEVSITAKSEYESYIYDTREAVTDEEAYSGAIHSEVDLEICGKGALTLVSEQNNGIHSKKDLQVKNLNLLVACVDNALKGNDSVELENASTTLIASAGDGIKTTNSDVSSKGNQRGTISIVGGIHNIYAACDGLDAAYNVTVEDSSTQLNIYTDRYSNYSTEVTDVDAEQAYICFESKDYQYSVKYYNSDEDFCWVNAEYHSEAMGNYFYAYPKLSGYSKVRFFVYDAQTERGQDQTYIVATDYLTPNEGYDTFMVINQGNFVLYQWTNYDTATKEGGFGGPGGQPGGQPGERPGGRPGGDRFGRPGGNGGFYGAAEEQNQQKLAYSAKGIKAANEITLCGGTVNIKAYDDAIHANADSVLENGETPVGNVTVSGGALTLYSQDDGLHADGTVHLQGGTVHITKSYEGVEGAQVRITGGHLTVQASDDGINSTATAETGVEIGGGSIYISCTGDGIDTNTRTAYQGIVFSGGDTAVFTNSPMNSSLDTEQGYQYTGGNVLAVMPSRGMTMEATHCSNLTEVGTTSVADLRTGSYLTVTKDGSVLQSVEIPMDLNAYVVYLGSTNAAITTEEATES